MLLFWGLFLKKILGKAWSRILIRYEKICSACESVIMSYILSTGRSHLLTEVSFRRRCIRLCHEANFENQRGS
jgi:hypothetical protein